jgi:phosphoribosylformylglycinamidine synthase
LKPILEAKSAGNERHEHASSGNVTRSLRSRLASQEISRDAEQGAADFALANVAAMKAKIIITPKKAVVDPQGKTVQGALEHMGYTGVGAVHVGKYLEIELAGGDKETARQQIDDACHRILSNPVIEDYRFEIE